LYIKLFMKNKVTNGVTLLPDGDVKSESEYFDSDRQLRDDDFAYVVVMTP